MTHNWYVYGHDSLRSTMYLNAMTNYVLYQFNPISRWFAHTKSLYHILYCPLKDERDGRLTFQSLYNALYKVYHKPCHHQIHSVPGHFTRFYFWQLWMPLHRSVYSVMDGIHVVMCNGWSNDFSPNRNQHTTSNQWPFERWITRKSLKGETVLGIWVYLSVYCYHFDWKYLPQAYDNA